MNWIQADATKCLQTTGLLVTIFNFVFNVSTNYIRPSYPTGGHMMYFD